MVAIRPKVRREKPRFRSSCCWFSDRTVVIFPPLAGRLWGADYQVRSPMSRGRAGPGRAGPGGPAQTRGSALLRAALQEFLQRVEGNPPGRAGPFVSLQLHFALGKRGTRTLRQRQFLEIGRASCRER